MEIGPILPKYIHIMIRILPAVSRCGVRSRERPTVPSALATSYIALSSVTPLPDISRIVMKSNAPRLMKTIALAFLIISSGTVL